MENDFTLHFRLDELAALEKTVDVPIPPHVIWDNTENITLGGEGATYYEQYTIPGPKITYYLVPNGVIPITSLENLACFFAYLTLLLALL